MDKGRLEAFSDGVLAIIITIMVLELKVPEGASLAALRPVLPVFLGYVLSFVYVGIYWNNHHHMFHATRRVRGPILWANLHLLFWLSLFPVTTAWLGANPSEPLPAALYGLALLLAGTAYKILQELIIRDQGRDALLATAVGSDFKGWISLLLYLVALLCAFVAVWIAEALYVAVALIWLVPDTRIERLVGREDGH
jgi:uncharacterized membrane protein